jgi:cyclophilin family peptidyl-prolyl cis-trans isomerase
LPGIRVDERVYVEFVKGVDEHLYLNYHIARRCIDCLQRGQACPIGLGYDAATQTVTGTATTVEVREADVRLEFSDGWIKETTVTFRVLAPPIISEFLPPLTLYPSNSTALVMGGFFFDPDVDSAVEMTTSLGPMRWALFDSVTPLTVSNLMAYATAGDYTNTVFHRNVPGFVVQGGAFRPTRQPGRRHSRWCRPVLCYKTSPGLSAVRGTLSMAKLGGDPDSATNQFFINLNNNGPILNQQNGGFTVFGRVVNADMSVADTMATLPTSDYDVLFDGEPAVMEDWPLLEASQTMDNALAVLIHGIMPIPVLQYEVFTNSNPAVASATLVNGDLTVLALTPGETVIGVRAIDLDGLVVEQTMTITVPQLTYAQWALENIPGGQTGPLEDADAGGLRNLEEFAFMGVATNSVDDVALAPVFTLSPRVGGVRTWSAEFNLRKYTDLRFSVWVADAAEDSAWLELWNDQDDGMASEFLENVQDLGTHFRVRLSDTFQDPGSSERHIGVRIDQP